jgi:hypothetical protein
MWQGDGKGKYLKEMFGRKLEVFQKKNQWFGTVDGVEQGPYKDRLEAMVNTDQAAAWQHHTQET